MLVDMKLFQITWIREQRKCESLTPVTFKLWSNEVSAADNRLLVILSRPIPNSSKVQIVAQPATGSQNSGDSPGKHFTSSSGYLALRSRL